MKTARLFTRLRCPAETLSDGPFLNGRAIVARFNGRNSSGSGKTAHDRRCRRFPPLLRKEKYWLVAAPQRVRNFFYFSLFIISFFSLSFSLGYSTILRTRRQTGRNTDHPDSYLPKLPPPPWHQKQKCIKE